MSLVFFVIFALLSGFLPPDDRGAGRDWQPGSEHILQHLLGKLSGKKRWSVQTKDVWAMCSDCPLFFNPTDTQAHQVQTLRRVQPLHCQVWPPLSVGGELCRYAKSVTVPKFDHKGGGCYYILFFHCLSTLQLFRLSPTLMLDLQINVTNDRSSG